MSELSATERCCILCCMLRHCCANALHATCLLVVAEQDSSTPLLQNIGDDICDVDDQDRRIEAVFYADGKLRWEGLKTVPQC